MSDFKQVLVHVSDSPLAPSVARFAATLTAEHGGALTALHAVDPMPTGAYLTPEASTIAARLSQEAAQARRETARALIAEVAAETPIEFASADGDPLEAALRQARACDLLVLGQRSPEVPDGLSPGFVGRLLMGAGCPLLFKPYAGEHERCGRRVLVAWSDRRESARALRDALPILRRAEGVELVHFAKTNEAPSEPMEAVLSYLRHHGIEATCTVRHSREPSIVERMLLSDWTPDTSIAEALLSHAADYGADLLVTGGYGHSRAWELALGGVTRTLLRTMTVPVLMSH
jgi:nucleotide-binding universal stress UspA family protein